jgi:hypothetical protein
MIKDGPAGFDITLMQRIAVKLGREWQLVPYNGADFNGIFAGLDSTAAMTVHGLGHHDHARTCQRIADFCAPICSLRPIARCRRTSRHPSVHGIGDLKGLVIGVQHGNTSQPVADTSSLPSIAPRACCVYAYDEDRDGARRSVDRRLRRLHETRAGHGDGSCATGRSSRSSRPASPCERLGICVGKGNTRLLADAITKAQAALVVGRHAGSADQAVARGRRDSAGVRLMSPCGPERRLLRDSNTSAIGGKAEVASERPNVAF